MNTIAYMDEEEEKEWINLLIYFKLFRHPKWLSMDDRKHQKRLLDVMSADPYNLPTEPKLDEWWQWHIDQEAAI